MTISASTDLICLARSTSHKLIRSKLSRSPLRTLLTIPNLKNLSSPAAVRPPMYILSAPRTSRNPSELASLPRRRDGCCACGMGMALGECSLAACAAAAAVAVADVAAAAAVAVDGVETE